MSVEVRGHDIAVKEGAFQSWAVFELLATINDADANPFERTNSMFKLLELATDATKADVIEWAGGEDADYKAVFELLAEIVSAAVPKNF